MAIFTAVLGCKRDAPQTSDAASAELVIASTSAPSADVASPQVPDSSADVVDASVDAADATEGGKHAKSAVDASAELAMLNGFGLVDDDASMAGLIESLRSPYINQSCGVSITPYTSQPNPEVVHGEVMFTVLSGTEGADVAEFARIRAKMRSCVDAELKLDPSTEGTLLLDVMVAPSGAVSSVTITNTTLLGALTSCLSTRMRAGQFGPTASSRKVVVSIRATRKN